MKNLTILGATGSIGVNTLNVVKAHPKHYRVMALSAGRNIDLLSDQIHTFNPKAVAVLNDGLAEKLEKKLQPGHSVEILSGPQGYKRVSIMDGVDTVVSAMTGAAGLEPTYEAIRSGRNIALANKETMVMAGPLVMAEAKRRGVSILPVDSEHSAIFQSLQGHERTDLKRIILTASGGPFRDFALEEMAHVTASQALNHPNWEMGPKITIDSATMMNKGLEIIEAKWLFDLDMDQIDVLIHPQSIIHSMVEYMDGSTIGQMGVANMMIPIAYALSHPRHLTTGLSPLALDKIGTLTFEKPDFKRFKCLGLAVQAAEKGDSMQAVMNAANEIAVAAFLENKIGYLDIPDLIETTMKAHQPYPVDKIDDVLAADQWARKTARSKLSKNDSG